MKYMVMECHPGYAVVLDENGQFRKVANMRYEVGQTVTDVTELNLPQAAPVKRNNTRWVTSLMAAAACLLMLLIPSFALPNVAYASVYMTINPEVRIDVNRQDIVVGLEGVNEDGKTLIAGYSYQKKDLDTVVDELVDRAIQMNFLHEGDKISLALDADDQEWVLVHSDSIGSQLDKYLEDKIAVTIEVSVDDDEDDADSDEDIDDDEDDDTDTDADDDDDDDLSEGPESEDEDDDIDDDGDEDDEDDDFSEDAEPEDEDDDPAEPEDDGDDDIEEDTESEDEDDPEEPEDEDDGDGDDINEDTDSDDDDDEQDDDEQDDDDPEED